MIPRTGLDVVENRKVSCPYLDSILLLLTRIPLAISPALLKQTKSKVVKVLPSGNAGCHSVQNRLSRLRASTLAVQKLFIV